MIAEDRGTPVLEAGAEGATMDHDEMRSSYAADGFVRVASAMTHAVASRMADVVWTEVEAKHRVRRGKPETWSISDPRGLGAVRSAGSFDGLATPAVLNAIDILLGVGDWSAPATWGGPLVTLPAPGQWSVPSSGWHLDYPVRGAPATILRLKWLAYLEPVVATGGGTVVIAGSHRLVEQWARQADAADQGRSGAVRDAIFATHPWFEVLRGDDGRERDQALMRGDVVSGVPVRVVELTGDVGDVVFLHPHLFHAAATNNSSQPRLMVTGGLEVARHS